MDYIVEKRRSFIINFLYFGIFLALYYLGIKYLFSYLLPFIIATALAVFLQKPVRKISEKLHIKAHGVVSLLLVLLIVVTIVGVLGLIGYSLANEVREFFVYLFSQFSSVDDIVNSLEGVLKSATSVLPGNMSARAVEFIENAFNNIGKGDDSVDYGAMISGSLSGAWTVVKGIPSVIVAFVVTIISSVFMTSEYDLIRDMLLGMCSDEQGEKLVKTKRTVTVGVFKLIKAYSTLMLITFAEMCLGLNILKLLGAYEGGYIAIISLVTCVVDIVPVLGTGTVVLPWAIYNFFTGNIGMGIGLVILYAVITVIRQAIEPKLVANQVGLPSIITIMGMFLGARLFGAFGILLVPFSIIVLKLMYDEGIIGYKNVCKGKAASEESVNTKKLSEKQEVEE